MIETFPTESNAETRVKRARMRAWRRGMREMDLILGRFIDAEGATLSADELTAFEALLARRDQDLYDWVSGRMPKAPENATSGELTLIARLASTRQNP